MKTADWLKMAYVVFTLCVATAVTSMAQSYAVLHSFAGPPNDGAYSWAALAFDGEGNLYGTTIEGGIHPGCGVVFRVDPAGSETVLYNFASGADGCYPEAGVVLDVANNIYGTTALGGAVNGCEYGANGCGVVFKLNSTGAETVLHAFGEGTDGVQPLGRLVRDSSGNLYGTTWAGGADNRGTVFGLSADGTETMLYSFGSEGTDGTHPVAGLIRNAAGSLYGTTVWGGGAGCLSDSGCGTVFEVTASGTGRTWYNLTGAADGGNPFSTLVRDSVGNLYGTTVYGGDLSCGEGLGCGTVFKVDPAGNETVLYSFTDLDGDGANPYAGLVKDSAGNLYGTTINGGDGECDGGCGTVFEVTATGEETVLHSFRWRSGAYPEGGLLRDRAGNLYGTTYMGGAFGYGVVYRVTP